MLREIYKKLEKTKLPPFSGFDELDKWIEDLIEIDAYYAGLACSVAGGGIKVFKKELPELKPLEEKLSFLISSETVDKNIAGHI